MADVGNVRRDWERLGEEDPLWAVLSSEGKRGGNWDEAEFFRTGVEFVDQLMPDVAVHLPGQVLGDALDFGCGVGRLSQPLGRHFRTVTGVDVSAAMLDRARAANTADNITFVHNT